LREGTCQKVHIKESSYWTSYLRFSTYLRCLLSYAQYAVLYDEKLFCFVRCKWCTMKLISVSFNNNVIRYSVCFYASIALHGTVITARRLSL